MAGVNKGDRQLCVDETVLRKCLEPDAWSVAVVLVSVWMRGGTGLETERVFYKWSSSILISQRCCSIYKKPPHLQTVFIYYS